VRASSSSFFKRLIGPLLRSTSNPARRFFLLCLSDRAVPMGFGFLFDGDTKTLHSSCPIPSTFFLRVVARFSGEGAP